MKHCWFCLVITLCIAFVVSAANAARPSGPEAIALRLLDQLDAGQYEAAAATFTDTMRTALPAARLQEVWEVLPTQVGAARGRGEAALAPHGLMTLVVVPLHYAQAELVAKIAVDPEGRIGGFLIVPAPLPAAVAPSGANYLEREVTIGAGAHALPATLTLPKGRGPFPAVVLVHGSGPQDRDETIGANRPFLDIAQGLGAHGIAVLRYEKRSKAHPNDYADGTLTVDTETTQDAVAAVSTLRALDGIDDARVYIFGHSQGAMMAPRIAQQAGTAGAILLAAPARPLLDILIEQNQRLAASNGDVSAEETAVLAQLTAQVAQLRQNAEVWETPMGLPAAYWRSLDSVDAVAEAKALRQPLLLLHGDRDIQIAAADWQRWQAALGGDPRATLKHYPALNHLAIAGEGPGTLAEYNQAGHVDAQLIDDVAGWIRSH